MSGAFSLDFFRLSNPPLKYDPLDSSGLFRDLAAVEPTVEGIQAFANRFGTLTEGRLFIPEGKEEKMPTPEADVRVSQYYEDRLFERPTDAKKTMRQFVKRGAILGDSLSFWQEEIRMLRTLIGLWEALRSSDRKAIGKFVQFDWNGKHRTIKVFDEDCKTVVPLMNFKPEVSEKLKLEAAAEYVLSDALSDLTANTSGILLFPPESKYRRKLAIVPRSLRDAIWLQFALAVLENKKYRACEVCGKSFEVSPQVARTTRTLCSSACKQKAHRQRRDQALKLAQEGLAAREIARRVGSQLTTVQNWLKEFKEKH